MANLIRLKQLDQADLSGFFNDAFVNTGLASKTYVDRFSDQTVSGIKTFENGINLDNIDNLNLSGVDISIGDASVSITNSDLGTSSANLIVQGSGDFFKGIKLGSNQIGSLNPAIILYDSPNGDYNQISWNDSYLTFINIPNINNQSLGYDFSVDPAGTVRTIAVDSKVVHNTTNETISGVKTFANPGIFNTISGDFSLDISTPYDLTLRNGIGASLYLGGEEKTVILSGAETSFIFTYLGIISPFVDIVGRLSGSTGIFGRLFANNLVYNTGNQTISGVKTFENSIIANTISGKRTSIFFGDRFNLNLEAMDNVYSPAPFVTGGGGIKIVGGSGSYFGGPVALYGGRGPNGIYDGSIDIRASSINFNISDTSNIGKSVTVYKTGSVENLTIQENYINVNNQITVSGNVNLSSGALTASNLVYNTGAQNISGSKTFFDSGIFSLSGASPLSLPSNPLSIVGSGNTYLQLNIQNRATGLTASSDLVITANNGTDSTNFINLGINNVGYNDPAFTNGTGLDGYLFIDGGNLDIGTRTAGRAIEFHAGGTIAGSTIARINQNGLGMVSGYVFNTVNAAVVAGTNAQGQGPLTSQVNIIITNANNPGGVTLPTALSGFSSRIMVRNTAANPVNVYPANGARIDASGINFSGAYLIQNAQKEFYSVGTGQWYSI
jgi:hypothetical protein